MVTRYADVESVFLDPETYSAAAAQLPLVGLVPEALRILAEGGHRPQPSMVSLDQPEHTRLRRPALTFPLPATIIFSFMGVPERDWPTLKAWCGSRASLAWGRPAEDEQVEHARNMAAYRGYLRELVAAKAVAPADDYCSALLAIHDEDPESLTHEEIASILFSLSFAGHETTNYLIGNLARRLLEDRARWEAVAADRTLIAGAVEETLRYDTSVPAWRRIRSAPSRWAASLSPRAPSCSSGWERRGAIPPPSPNPSASTSGARTPTTTSPSARASTTARARASASSRRASPSTVS